MINKKKLIEELNQTKSDNLHYRGMLVKITDILRTSEEIVENPYITLRNIKNVISGGNSNGDNKI